MSTQDFNATIDVRTGEELDMSLIQPLIDQHITVEGAAEVTQFPAGQSNLTYQLTYPGGLKLVLRRPPFGTIPKSGHSMIREFEVMQALKPVFSAVPDVIFHVSAEDSPIGAEFYVMRHVDGVKPGRNMPKGVTLSEADARSLCLAFVDKLIELHSVDYKAAGLENFGKPEGYVERQIMGWNNRWRKAKTDDVPDYSDVTDWLEANMPKGEEGHSIVHGDYRLDNLILDPGNLSNILAVLDWEISALGDPLMDLGNTLAYWLEEGDPEDVKMLRMQPSHVPGMLTRSEIVAYYGEKTGRNMAGFSFYLVYGTFRLAVILQQIYYRYYHGQTKNPGFANFGKQVAVLGDHARRLIAESKG